jgi:hypothetical protein
MVLTSHLTEVFEKVLREEIVDHLLENNLLNQVQHGFTLISDINKDVQKSSRAVNSEDLTFFVMSISMLEINKAFLPIYIATVAISRLINL